jgi:hypothetical protein
MMQTVVSGVRGIQIAQRLSLRKLSSNAKTNSKRLYRNLLVTYILIYTAVDTALI